MGGQIGDSSKPLLVLVGEKRNPGEVRANSAWSVFATTFKATVGSGFIALPYAIEAAGLVGGAVMIILVWLCTSITTKQLVMCSSIVNQKDPSILARKVDYGAIGYSAYGQKGRLVCILPVLITQFIAGVSFLVFIESTFDPLISQSYSPFFVMGVVICIQLALAMAPDPGFMVPIAKSGLRSIMEWRLTAQAWKM